MARIEVPMPQMGESIAEGTVSKWIKKVGDEVARDEPLLEISTDKVDAEIPSPQAGTLVEVVVTEGTTVEVGSILAYIETDKAAAGSAAPDAAPAAPAAAQQTSNATSDATANSAGAGADQGGASSQQGGAAAASAAPAGEETAEERLKRKSTPLVRKIAEEHGVDIAQVEGSGTAGRVTKNDIMSYLDKGGAPQAASTSAPQQAAPQATSSQATSSQATAQPAAAKPAAASTGGGAFSEDALWNAFYGKVRHPEFPVRQGDKVEPMNRMRKLTADHMVRAKRIAPHVHSFIEIDFTAIDKVRGASKGAWEKAGAKVSYTAFVAWAVARTLRDFPSVNSTISGDNVIYRGAINIGIAVDLNPGLIVPVIRNADELNLVGIAKRITDLADRARSKKLAPDEIQGATFSITNPGVLGTVVGMPIIPEGTSAILGTGSIEKKAVVITVEGADVIAIRKRSMFSIGYDHRIVDGADAARFLAQLKQTLESFPEDA
jgi:2-oxoglutarate dehydrogenase E2 component (dihydrolipoamide succinyltransferase)